MVLDYFQTLMDEATLLYDTRRKRKVEFTGGWVFRKEPDFKPHFCILIGLHFFPGNLLYFHSFPIFKFECADFSVHLCRILSVKY